MKPKIAIVGAGPAGSSLAIRLAGQGFAVTLIEREKFPRHKLCGEFISPECLSHFHDLGVLDEMLSAGGDHIAETVFFARSGKHVAVPSKWFGGAGYALSLSRAEMDHRLLLGAKAAGAKVLEETSATGLLMEDETVTGIKTRGPNGEARELRAGITIDATGRTGLLGKLLHKGRHKPAIPGSSKLIGFKAHLKNVSMEKGRCEIYSFPGGYGGLSYVEEGAANFCFLIRAKAARELGGKTNKIVEEIVFQNKRARRTLETAEPVHDWLAVAVDSFGKKELSSAKNLFSVGDAAAFIDPFTGSGMLMALESSSILARAIIDNYLLPGEITSCYAAVYRKTFARRLRVCSLMRRAAFVPNLAGILISALKVSEKSRELLIKATRTSLSARHGGR
jgi:menaquinone-9 beta-reductase